ncbi:MAG: hypothetical protein IT161_19815 [Bryobacterales bacterium]|nr:hypothetical protein [Bryobacterales bacterium]
MSKLITAFGLGMIAAGLAAYLFISTHSSEPRNVAAAPATVGPAPPPAPLPDLPQPADLPQVKAKDAASKPRPRPANTVAKPTPTPAPGATDVAPVTAHAAPEAPVQAKVESPPPAVEPAPAIPAQVEPPPAPPPPPAAPRTPRTALIPAGTLITVRLNEPLSSAHNQAGYTFRVILEQPLISQNLVIAERGTVQLGKIVDLTKGGRGPKAQSSLSLELTELTTADGQKVAVHTETFVHKGDTAAGWHEAAKVGAGAAIGAAIGAILGGGQGAAIGAGIGGAAGTGAVLASKSAEARLPAETRITFRLTEPVTLTEKLD